MCGPKFCSMNISQDINESVKTINIKNIESEMKKKSEEFKNLSNIYVRNARNSICTSLELWKE